MINIRKARPEDSYSIGNVHVAAVKAIDPNLYTQEEIQAWAVPRKVENYQELIRTREFFVAEEDGDLVGFAVLDPPSATIEAVYVSPTAGKRGIGRQLLQKLEESACILGLTELCLYASLNAVPFYERAGYVGQEPSKYQLLSGLEIACVPMTKAMREAK